VRYDKGMKTNRVPVSYRLPETVVKKLKILASRDNRSQGMILQLLIEEAFERLKKGPKPSKAP